MIEFHLDTVSFYNKDARDMSEVGAETVDLVMADGPYGQNYLTKSRLYPNDIAVPILGDVEFQEGLYRDVLKECYRVLKKDSALYLFTNWRVYGECKAVVSELYSVRNCLIWDKQQWTGGDIEGAYAHAYEMILFAVKGNPKLRCEGRPQDLISVPRVFYSHMLHPMQKPAPLLAQLIRNSSDEGDLVLDPFAGVASTLEAARLNGRRAIGYEVETFWFARGVERLRQIAFDFKSQPTEVQNNA